MKEVGSEFAIETIPQELDVDQFYITKEFNFWENSLCVLAGRTGIDCICKDILSSRKVKNVYMPAYCCSSMIDPFIKNGIQVEFYDVQYNGTNLSYIIDQNKYTDILYINNYFGYINIVDTNIIHHFQRNGSLIIYDKTHSLLSSNDSLISMSNYVLSSLRKWFAIASGAVISKRDGTFNLPNELKLCNFVKDKIEAQHLKYIYLNGDRHVSKNAFYSKFSTFDKLLTSDYSEYKMDSISLQLLYDIDMGFVKEQRIENAQYYYKELSNVDEISFLCGTLNSGIVPLFIPILIKNKKDRIILGQQLISKKMYCPHHWVKDNRIPQNMDVNDIYDRELSLICDQRYFPENLQVIVETIKEYYK